MAGNINVRRDDETSRQPLAPQARSHPRPEWEPARVMRALLSWDPFREMGPSVFGNEPQLMAAFDVKDTPDAFVFQADVPGLQEKDIEVQLDGNRLTIRGKRETEQRQPGHTYYAYERSFGSFARSFTLPASADGEKCTASLHDGVLTVMVPKKAKEQPKTIAVKSQSMKS
jgi:HSP20 family protein